jgi:hypothetical protein
MQHNCKLPADYRQHALTFLSFYGKERLSTQENLFEVIKKCEPRFVVDNNINWFELSASPGYANAAFILGTTTDKEASPLRLLLERKDQTPKIRPNVFLFGMKSPTPEDALAGHRTPLLVISRLDAHATNIRDMSGLRKFDQPGGGKAKWDTSESIEDEKRKVLTLLAVKSIEEVPRLRDRDSKDTELRLSIKRERPNCTGRFWESNDVSRFAFARLLLCSSQARSEFAQLDYNNVFGDRALIQNALFLGAGILSKDKGVAKMARLCGLQCAQTVINS